VPVERSLAIVGQSEATVGPTPAAAPSVFSTVSAANQTRRLKLIAWRADGCPVHPVRRWNGTLRYL
jgi:hypothetical protein